MHDQFDEVVGQRMQTVVVGFTQKTDQLIVDGQQFAQFGDGAFFWWSRLGDALEREDVAAFGSFVGHDAACGFVG